jgi:glycine/D-amino acid oxidase-like deaminating enzyme
VPARRIVIIGAGVVGAALADELVLRGERDVTVVDKGPLFATGGSSSHAPGLISRTSTSRFMTETADATVRKYATLSTDAGPALLPVGTLEVAYSEERLAELWRRWGAARSFEWQGRMIGPNDAVGLWPTIEPGGLLGAYATDGEGLAAALRAVEAQAGRAADGGATFVGERAISQIITDDGAARGVRTAAGEDIPADVVVCCAGVWGPALAATVGLTLPMLPTEHQYAITSPIPELRSSGTTTSASTTATTATGSASAPSTTGCFPLRRRSWTSIRGTRTRASRSGSRRKISPSRGSYRAPSCRRCATRA